MPNQRKEGKKPVIIHASAEERDAIDKLIKIRGVKNRTELLKLLVIEEEKRSKGTGPGEKEEGS